MPKDSRKILIVDDNEQLSMLYEAVLKDEGLDAKAVFSATDALKTLAQMKEKYEFPSLILLDCLLPDLNGGELAVKIRELYPVESDSAWIIGFSSLSNGAAQVQNMEKSVDAYVEKPNDLNDFIKMVTDNLPQAA